MLMTDWSHMLGVEMFNAHHHSDGDNKPPTILMNGKGVFREFPLDDGSDEVTYTPVEVFTVKQVSRKSNTSENFTFCVRRSRQNQSTNLSSEKWSF